MSQKRRFSLPLPDLMTEGRKSRERADLKQVSYLYGFLAPVSLGAWCGTPRARRYRYHGGVRVRARLRAGGPVTSFHYFEYL